MSTDYISWLSPEGVRPTGGPGEAVRRRPGRGGALPRGLRLPAGPPDTSGARPGGTRFQWSRKLQGTVYTVLKSNIQLN